MTPEQKLVDALEKGNSIDATIMMYENAQALARRVAALQAAAQTYTGLPGRNTSTIIGVARDFEEYLKEG